MIFPDHPDGRPMKRSCRSVVRMLREAGERGVTTGEFTAANVARAAARMGELRRIFGYSIDSRRITPNSYRFTLIAEPEVGAGRATEETRSHTRAVPVDTSSPSPRPAIFEADFEDAA